MRSRLMLPIVLALLVGSAVVAEEKSDEAAAGRKTVQAMSWIAGDWSGPMWGGTFHAHYASPEGGRLLSESELVKAGRVGHYEFESFRARGEKVELTPFPGGKRAATFTLTEHDREARRATFENPKNDFPSRIVYHRVADDRLVITLSAPHHGSDKEEVFDLQAVRD